MAVQNVKQRVVANFPTSVVGVGGIDVSKAAGVWTITPDFSALQTLASLDAPDNKTLWVYDPDTDDFYQVEIQTLLTSLLSGIASPRIITTDSAVVNATDTAIIFNRDAADLSITSTLTLPSTGDRNGLPLPIIDYSDNLTGTAEHTITITPNGSEKIMRQSSWQLVSTASQLASIKLYPSPDLSGWVVAGTP